MIYYQMPVLTEQEKKHAIYDAEERVHAFKSYCKLNPGEKHAEDELLLLQIALAALTAKPVTRVSPDQMHRVCLEATRHLDKYKAMAVEVNKLLMRTNPVPVKQEGGQ